MNKFLLLFSLAAMGPNLAWAEKSDLVSKLTSGHVDISVNYTGDQITLFGAMSGPGQVVVKVSSPDESVALEKKGRTGPFWLGQCKHHISNTPGLYYLLSSADIDSILPPKERDAHGLDLKDALKNVKVTPEATGRQLGTVKDAVLRLKQAQHRYVVDSRAVSILGERLYSTRLNLPAQLPLGEYQVDVFLVNKHKVVASDRQHIHVEEVRLEHWVSAVATHRSWLFGIVFTAAMLLLGLFLGVVLGRGKKI